MQRRWIIFGETGRVKIHANRGGTIHEITDFLHDLELSYAALIDIDSQLHAIGRYLEFFGHWGPPRKILKRYGLFPLFAPEFLYEYKSDEELLNRVPPNYRLEIDKVSINSPGFWEFLGALNPLEQIRKYLQERHNRIREKELREHEKERMILENELIRQQIIHERLKNMGELYRLHIEYDEMPLKDLEDAILANLTPRLMKLVEHQDRGLIE